MAGNVSMEMGPAEQMEARQVVARSKILSYEHNKGSAKEINVFKDYLHATTNFENVRSNYLH